MVARRAWVALLPLVFFAGCRAAGVGSLAPPRAEVAARPNLDLEQVLAEHNRNARLVQSLRAQPSIKVVVDRHEYGVHGRLALERPRDFRLVLQSTMHDEADIGSNDSGFWFWTRHPPGSRAPKEYFVGGYDESGSTALTAAYQPDWIIETLGLSEISAEGLKVERTPSQNQLVLTSRHRTREGWAVTKVTYMDARNGLILREVLYQGDQPLDLRTKLAVAEVIGGKYQRVPVRGEGDSASEVVLPSAIRLQWVREGMRLDVTLNQPEINPQLTAELFQEPDFKKLGYRRTDLDSEGGLAGSGPGSGSGSSSTRIRESRPAPPAGVQLDEPQPIGMNPSRGQRRSQAGSSALAAVPERPRPDELVGARLPSPPENRGWQQAQMDGQERGYEP